MILMQSNIESQPNFAENSPSFASFRRVCEHSEKASVPPVDLGSKKSGPRLLLNHATIRTRRLAVLRCSDHIRGDDADDFFEGSLAREGAGEAALPQGAHALFDGDFLQGQGGDLFEHRFAKGFVDDQQLTDG